jgi:hypothetical protein
MKAIVAAGVASALAIGSLGYIAGAKSASGAAADPFAVSAFEGTPAPAVARTDYVARPAARRVTSPVGYESAPRATASPAVIREAPEQPEPKRSWKKTALIIGAGAGSGAVVGGIIDGKKGAGIGAAIGGGAASVYEVLKRR